MNLQDLKERGFLGPDTVKRMRRTLPGLLADFIDRVLYDVQELAGDKDKLLVNAKTFVQVGPPAPGPFVPDTARQPYAGLDENGDHADTRRALREVVHYLEACALREALGGK